MDSDLSFLRQASNEDLDPLVGYILNAESSQIATNTRATTLITVNTWI